MKREVGGPRRHGFRFPPEAGDGLARFTYGTFVPCYTTSEPFSNFAHLLSSVPRRKQSAQGDSTGGVGDAASTRWEVDERDGTERASRFPLPLPLLYRGRGQRRWRNGTVENISYSGVLFRAQDLMQPDAEVEMRLALPAGIKGEPPAKVICQGRIVRVQSSAVGGGRPGLAASITAFNIVRGRKARHE